MPLTNAEQYALELINRARLDPLAEMKRLGLSSLNDGLASGTIKATAKEALAPQEHLESSAQAYAVWIGSPSKNGLSWPDLQQNYLPYHYGPGKNSYADRIYDADYNGGSGANWVGENLTLRDYNGTTFEKSVVAHHADWMNSPGHRLNILRDEFREIGYAQERGTVSGVPVSVAVTDFGKVASRAWVTGVAYSDRDGDGFYSMGEGRSGLKISVLKGDRDTTTGAGGYAVSAKMGSDVTVKIGKAITIGVDLAEGNVKVDLVNGSVLKVSGDVTLISGIARAELLGVVEAGLTGNDKGNILTGNSARNTLSGEGGNDVLRGGGGNDALSGGKGRDRLYGDFGNDTLTGGQQGDKLYGGAGKDRLAGEAGSDMLYGGAGADTFVLGKGHGADRVMDLSMAERDRLAFDDNLWTGKLNARQVVEKFASVTEAGVVFDFGRGNMLVLEDLTTTDGLSARIGIF